MRFFVPKDYDALLPTGAPIACIAIRRALDNLLNDTSSSVVLKKKFFSGKVVYTLNVNAEGRHRLIFEKVRLKSGNELIYVLRSIALHHDYVKALMWTPFAAGIEEHELVDYVGSGMLVVHDERTTKEVFYKQQWFDLTPIQHGVLENSHLPSLLVGSPGSGKTLLAMSMLQERALAHQKEKQGLLKLLYFSSQAALNRDFLRSWSKWAQQYLDDRKAPVYLQVLTPAELSSWRDGSSLRVLTQEQILALIDSKLGINPQITKEKVLGEFLTSSHVLNQDLGGPYSHSNYSKIGATQSQLAKEHHEFVYDCYQQTMDVLAKRNEAYPGLTVADSAAAFFYDCAVIDEVQLLSMQDVLNVFSLMKNKEVLLCGDSNQQGMQQVSCLSFLRPTLYQRGIVVGEPLELTKSHRLRPSTAKVCSTLVLLNNHLYGGKFDKTAYSEFDLTDEEEGSSVVWLDSITEQNVKDLGANEGFAVLVFRAEDLDDVKKYWNIDNRFVISEQIGLEFSQVLIYLSQPVMQSFVAVSQLMLDKGINVQTVLNPRHSLSAAKGSAATSSMVTARALLSQLMVALSRARGGVWIYGDSAGLEYRLRGFLPWFKAQCKGTQVIQAHVSSPEEWLQRINQFIRAEYIVQAQDNLKTHWHLTAAQAQEYVVWYGSGVAKSEDECIARCRSLRMSAIEVSKPPAVVVVPTPVKKCAPVTHQVNHSLKQKPQFILDAAAEKKDAWTKTPQHYVVELLQQTDIEYGRWLCDELIHGKTLLEWVATPSNWLHLGNDLKQIEKFDAFQKAVTPYLNKRVSLHRPWTNLQMLVNSLKGSSLTLYLNLIKEKINEASLEALISPMDEGLSLMAYLLLHKKGAELISQQILNTIPEKQFNAPMLSGIYQGVSLAYLLYANPAFDQFWANQLLRVSPKSYEQMVQKEGHALESTSLFYLLCSNAMRQFIPQNVLSHFQKKLNDRLFFMGKKNDPADTPFARFVQSMNGLMLLQRSPTLLNQITSERLCVTRGPEAGVDENTSVLYWLSGSEEGLKILQTLFERKPGMVGSINAKTLCAIRTAAAKEDENTSVVYWLSLHSEGLAILKTFIEQSPDGLSAETLCKRLTAAAAAGLGENTSALYFLSISSEGKDILQQFIERNPDGISAETLCARRTAAVGAAAENTSALYFLASSSSGQDILKTLINRNPDRIRAETLCARRTAAAGVNENTSALYWLSAYPAGRAILRTVIERNSLFAHGISAEALCAKRTVAAAEVGQVNTSALYWLVSSRDGLELLHKIIDINQEIISNISAETFNAKLIDANQREHSVASLLEHNDLNLFRKIVKLNPRLIGKDGASSKGVNLMFFASSAKRAGDATVEGISSFLSKCTSFFYK